jgi:hypothetical protein
LRAVVVLVVLLAATPARAEVAALADAGVTIEVPKGWTVQTTDHVVAIAAKDATLGIVLAAADETSADAVWDRLVAGATGQVADLAVGDRGEGRVGGMPAILATATGSAQGTDVSMVLGVLTTPGGGYVALLVTSEKPKGKAHAKEMQRALDSIAVIDEALRGLPGTGAAFAAGLIAAIEGNDTKKFLALVAPKLSKAGVSVKKAKLKKALKKWPAKKGGIAGYLGLQPGDWQAQPLGDTMFTLFRGDGTGGATLVVVEQVKGAWRVTGTVAATALR